MSTPAADRMSSLLAQVLEAIFGRVLDLPVGTPIFAAKWRQYRWGPSYEPIRVRVGWWNRRTVASSLDPTRYYFFSRGSTQYALPAEPEHTPKTKPLRHGLRRTDQHDAARNPPTPLGQLLAAAFASRKSFPDVRSRKKPDHW